MRLSFFVLFVFYAQQVAAQIPLAHGDEVIKISKIEYFLDKKGNLTKPEIEKQSFQTVESDDLPRMDEGQYIWIRIRLYNPYPDRIFNILEFEDPSLYEVVLYEGTEKPTYSGASIDQFHKDYQGNNTSFLVDTGPGEEEELYVRINSYDVIGAEATLSTEEVYHNNEINEHIFLGIFHGILALIALYSLFLFSITGKNEFMVYSIYIMCSMLVAGSTDGLTPMYLHSLVEVTHGYLEVFLTGLMCVVGLVFMTTFLQIKKWSPRLYTITKYVTIGVGLIFVIVLIADPYSSYVLMYTISVLALMYILVISFIASKRRVSQSKFFLASFLGYGFFIVLFILNIVEIIPFNFFIQYAIHFGILINLLILSVAMGVRIYRKYQRSINQEREKQELFSAKNVELEQLVAERTEKINQKETELRSIIDNSDNLIWLVNRKYEIRQMNGAFAEAWLQNFKKPILRNENIIDQLENAVEKKVWRKRYDKVFAGKSIKFEEVYAINNAKNTFEVNAYPIRENDQVIAAAFFSRNITDRLIYEQELKNKNLALQQVNEELDSFVYSASHDLKAPLASIQGLIGLVRDESNPDERLEYYDMMDKSIRRLDQFIRDIIDYSRNTRIELKSETIHLAQMAESILEDLKYMKGDDIQVSLIPNEEYPLVADPTRLRIILRNLLSNALSYGHKEGKPPEISVRWNIKKRKAIVEVCDKGQGIPEEHREKIFEMFYRANESSSGSGLGLYIVRESIRKMDGSVSVDSSTEGTCFRIAFPNNSKS